MRSPTGLAINMMRCTLQLSLALFIACIKLSSQGADAQGADDDDSVVWIDLRSAGEYRKGHIRGAINIPHGDIGHRIFVEVPDTFKEVHLYDGSEGTFAGIALEMLMEIGFQEVINEGGYEGLFAKQGIEK